MKLTPDNLDYEDCRPGTGVEIDMDLVPDHLKADVAAARATRKAQPAAPAAASPKPLPTADE